MRRQLFQTYSKELHHQTRQSFQYPPQSPPPVEQHAEDVHPRGQDPLLISTLVHDSSYPSHVKRDTTLHLHFEFSPAPSTILHPPNGNTKKKEHRQPSCSGKISVNGDIIMIENITYKEKEQL